MDEERRKEAKPGGQQPYKVEAPSWLIGNIAETSKNARSIYLLYLGFLAYCALTVIGTSDRQLILNEQTRLPILGLDVPLESFFITAPLLAVFIFAYLQLYLQRLKSLRMNLRENYAPVRKGRLYPWMINIAEDPEPGSVGKLQRLVVQISLWWLLPLVLVLFVHLFLKKHEPIASYVYGLGVPALGVGAALYFWSQYEDNGNLPIRGRSRSAMLRLPRSWARIILRVRLCLRSWGGVTLLTCGVLLGAYLLVCLIPAALAGKARTVDLSFQILIDEQVEDYNVPWADLQGVHLEGANLAGAVLKRANLSFAQLQGAILYGTQLQGADLYGAQLQDADLRYARLDSAFLTNAQLQDANLDEAQLQGADLKWAQLQGADLRYARLDSASLWKTQLQGADLTNAQLQGARLTNAQLQGTSLGEGLCDVETLYGAELDSALYERARTQCPAVLERPDWLPYWVPAADSQAVTPSSTGE